MAPIVAALKFSAAWLALWGTVQAVPISSDMEMGAVITKLSAAGVNTTLPAQALGAAAAQMKHFEAMLLHNKTCPADVQASFGQSEAQAMVSTWYTTSPFKCKNAPSSRTATTEAFAKFGYDAGSLANNPMALAVECILQETSDFLGSSWSGVNLTSMGTLYALVTYERSKALWSIHQPISAAQDAYMSEVKGLMSMNNQLALNPNYTERAMSSMAKIFMIYGNMFVKSENQMRISFYENIAWAVNVENKYNPSKENVLAGQKLLEWTESCLRFTKLATGSYEFTADGGVVPRFISLYTLWNYRFVKFFYTNVHPSAQECKATTGNANGYSSAKQVLHAFQSLTQCVSMASTSGEEWSRFRAQTLLAAAMAVTGCDGSVTNPALDLSVAYNPPTTTTAPLITASVAPATFVSSTVLLLAFAFLGLL